MSEIRGQRADYGQQTTDDWLSEPDSFYTEVAEIAKRELTINGH